MNKQVQIARFKSGAWSLLFVTLLFQTRVQSGAQPELSESKRNSTSDHSAGDELHWALKPIRRPTAPTVRNRDWVSSTIDTFVLANLEQHALTPAPRADRRILLRRVYYDLIGLPPNYADVKEFAKDESPNAFAKVVDRLLGSPRYGERWGRHWLDVARYADTKDLVLLYGKDRIRPYAYTYRDYVVRALNEDTPYDRFVTEQLAADQISPAVEPWRLAAMGFLTLGRLFDNNLPDIYDDQIDTTTRGFLALTVSCARCHDHKYDAVPQKDYYSLYGVFASSERPLELPLIADPSQIQGGLEFEAVLTAKRKELFDHIENQHKFLSETAKLRVTDYLMKVATEPPDPLETAIFFLSLSPEDLRPQFIAKWRRYMERNAVEDHPVFGPWHDFSNLPNDDFATRSRQTIQQWINAPTGIGPGQINPLIQNAIAENPPSSMADVARLYGDLIKSVYEDLKEDIQESGMEALSPEIRQVLSILVGVKSPIHFPKRDTYMYMSRVERTKYGNLVQELDKLAVNSPNAPPRAMVLTDASELYDPHVFVRGNPRLTGDPVQRQFLQILSGPDRRPFERGSGRLELASAITKPDNPLTSRVIANRLWMHHLGAPLVGTPNDFGIRSDPPSNPKLLDYLAWTLMESGWSLKKLHREILLSSTYQQSSFDRPGSKKVDPDNRYHWRANRRRLDFESMRDTLLAVSGRIDRAIGGRPVDAAGDPLEARRTIYGLVDRQDVPGVYRAFDFASPDQSAPRRSQTTTPQQALFGMNSPFVIKQAKALAKRPEITSNNSIHNRIEALFQIVYGRDPKKTEVDTVLSFLEMAEDAVNSEANGMSPWEQLGQVALVSNELMFVD